MNHFLPPLVAGAFLAATPGYAAAPGPVDTLDQAVGTQTRIDASANQSQTRVDKIADRTDTLLAEFRLVTRRTESLRVYNAHLEKIIKSQDEEIVSIGEQIDPLETTNREIVPLMIEMLRALQVFVDNDLPFLTDERAERLQGLRDIMYRADVTNSEKYRRVMEAYQQENEYGRTIESYKGLLEIGGGWLVWQWWRNGAGWIFGILIIIVGHTINITLSLIGGIIHGLRLNFLEWYRHCFEGGGKMLKPLRLFTYK